ncbi:MAG: hypothetical protein R3244_03880 [Thermoanaerobaculia bacterium]|nr:hypothetical protein [Thermoanaerobaculia bacterium]
MSDTTRRRQRRPTHLLGKVIVLGLTCLCGAGGLFAGQWPWTAWEVRCRDPKACEPADAIYEKLLEHASEWLDGLGFGPPRVTRFKELRHEDGTPRDRPVDKYYAEVSDEKNQGKTESVGVYFQTSDELFLRSEYFFTLGNPGETHDDPRYRAMDHSTFTPVHELFHAVENGYQDLGGTERDWIWEGAADAVARAYADAFEPELRVRERSRHSWDHPLHQPPNRSDRYGTWLFWRNIGRQIGSEGTIAYLHDVLIEDLEENRGLDGVDAALEPHGGLYTQLPRFFADLDIDQSWFGDIDRLRVAMPPGRTSYTKRFGYRHVREVAGSPHRMEVKTGRSSSDEPVEVEIRFASDHPDLHLIVDGTRYDSGGVGSRNRFRDLLLERNEASYEIVVANVAPEAANTTKRGYQFEVELTEVGHCAMSARVSGDVSGSYTGDVAHFSTRGGATNYGVFSNPEMMGDMLDAWGEMAAQFGGEEAQKEIEATKEEWMAEAGEIPRETFGLSLADQDLDDESEQAALAAIVGGFTLEASVIGTEVKEGFTGSLPLAMLRVVPGPRAESTLDKVAFSWVEGEPGSGQLTISRNTGDLVTGRVSGTLYAEGYRKPDGSKPMIRVDAEFVALPGPMGCLPVAAGLPF